MEVVTVGSTTPRTDLDAAVLGIEAVWPEPLVQNAAIQPALNFRTGFQVLEYM